MNMNCMNAVLQFRVPTGGLGMLDITGIIKCHVGAVRVHLILAFPGNVSQQFACVSTLFILTAFTPSEESLGSYMP